jgi:hypothetical protein
MHLELYNKIVINKKQRNISQNFQNEMHFPLLHYTSKNENKGHECCPKKKTIASFQWKENKEISKDACNKKFKNKKSKRVQTYKKLLYKDIILVVI